MIWMNYLEIDLQSKYFDNFHPLYVAILFVESIIDIPNKFI